MRDSPFKDTTFKKKDKSEKELLKDAIQELKKSDIADDILKAITEKEDKILSVSLEYYSAISKDTAEIKRLSELLTEKVEAMEEQISEKTAELLDRVSDFDLPRTYGIERDLDGVMDALYIHPTIIEGYIERPETEGLTTHQNNFLLVWDDFHVRPTLFMDTIYKLRNKFDNFYTLCAARSTEIENINDEIPLEFWEKANLTEVIELKELERDQNIELIRLCCKEFNIEASDEVVLSLAAKNEHSAGTPLYIVSVLIEFRDGQMKMGDIENLPGDVVMLWKDIYFPRLSADEKAVLYCLKLLKLVHTPAFKEIVRGMWKNICEKSKADLFTAIESLKRKIWLKEAENAYSSFDVQLEAVEIGNEWFEDFETFVRSNELEQKYQSLLLFNLSNYYSEKIKESKTEEELSSNLEKAIKYIEEAIVIYRELGLKAEVAGSLNNASGFYFYLVGLEETKEARKEKLDKAVVYIEEAIGIRKKLGLEADVAMSLNNASSFYSYLAGLEVTKEARKEKLDKAITYIEEAIGIRRKLDLKANLATSLNNAFGFYSDLARLEVTKEARKEKFDKAVEYIEEAIGIYEELGLKAYVAMSMNNASALYRHLAALGETKARRKELLDKAITYIEEAIGTYREFGSKENIATSMSNASNLYSDLAALGETKARRKELLDKAISYIEEAIGIYGEFGLKENVATSMSNASHRYSDLATLEETKARRKELLDKAITYIEEAIGIYRGLGLKAGVAMSMSNASNLYSDLATLEETKARRKELLEKAIEYIEEAIVICQELGLKADLAMSMHNASSLYFHLAALEETKEGWKELLDEAIEYIEKAIVIYREFGLKENVAMSMSNASNFHSALAALGETKARRKELLDKAITYIEEAIGIYRGLGLKAGVAMSMSNASNLYSDLAALEEAKESRKELLEKAIEYIEKAIVIYRELGLKANLAHSLAISVFVYSKIIEFDAKYFSKATVNCDEAITIFLDLGMVYNPKPLIPYGIKFHETLFEIDSEEGHKQVIEFYKSIGS